MKKIPVMLLVFVMLLASISVVSAEAETEAEVNVWLDSLEACAAGEKLSATIETDGAVTDGLVTLTYNQNLFDITESDIRKTEGILMYSVNASEDGTLRISFIADEAVTATVGTLFYLDFTAEEDVTAEALGQSFGFAGGTVHTNGSTDATMGVATPTPAPTEAPTATPTAAPTEEATTTPTEEATPAPTTAPTGPQGNGESTGDAFPTVVLSILAVAALAVAGGLFVAKKFAK